MSKRHSFAPPPLLPRAFRKRMSPQRLVEISLIHHVNLDGLLKGDPTVLLDFGASVLTWRNVANRLSLGQEEVATQVELFERLLVRHVAGQDATLDEQDQETARQGVVVMDMLAAEADIATAAWCAERAEQEMERRFVGQRTSPVENLCR